MTVLPNHLRFTVRQLLKNPGFVMAVTLTLGSAWASTVPDAAGLSCDTAEDPKINAAMESVAKVFKFRSRLPDSITSVLIL